MKGILLHGGHGTRLRPLTHTGPKQLLPIANKPMSQYCIESMKEAGVTEIAVIIGGVGSNKVREYYADGEKFGVRKYIPVTAKFVGGFFGFSIILVILSFFISAIPNLEGFSTSHNNIEASSSDLTNSFAKSCMFF